METAAAEESFSNSFEQVEMDAKIKYPCYKSFDKFIDVDRLPAA